MKAGKGMKKDHLSSKYQDLKKKKKSKCNIDGNNPLCFFYCSVFYFAPSASHRMQSILPLNNVAINELITAEFQLAIMRLFLILKVI